MSFEFETKMLKMASDRKRILKDGENLIKSERAKLNIERFFDIDLLSIPEERNTAAIALSEYKKQLNVEKGFYIEFHNSYVSEIEELTENLPANEKEKILTRSLPGLQDNHSIRMKMNFEKFQAVVKLERIVNIFNANNVHQSQPDKEISLENDSDIFEVDSLLEDIDSHLENQHNLSVLQRKRGVDGQKFIERLLNMITNS